MSAGPGPHLSASTPPTIIRSVFLLQWDAAEKFPTPLLQILTVPAVFVRFCVLFCYKAKCATFILLKGSLITCL
jgi:hypothetical protein